jgi:ABC-type Mn2+/Zn2+ transport system permease subunit
VSDFFAADFLFRNAILGGLGVALLCSVVGVYLVLRRLVLIGVALPQAGAAGIAAVFWLTGHGQGEGHGTHLLALAGSLAATGIALALLVASQRRARAPAEWGIGALFAITSAATILFIAVNPTGDFEMSSLLRGELLAITASDLRVLGAALLAAGLLFFLFRRELLLSSFDPEFARTVDRNPLRYDALLYALIGGSIALGVMEAGPLVVFGFLVLPALAALHLAPGLAAAFAISAAIGAASFLGGFALAYRADLPAGPVSVAVAAGFWLAAAALARLRLRRRAAALLALLVALASLPGCALWDGSRTNALGPLPRGALPEPGPGWSIAVLPFDNQTGEALRVPPANFLNDLPRLAGDPFAGGGPTVPELLAQRAAVELARRGFEVVPVERVRSLVSRAPADPASASRAAASANLDGPVLLGTLRRFTVSSTGILLIRLDLALVDPKTKQVLWTGAARRPVPIQAAQTWQEILLDAGAPIFAEAFGNQ